MSEGDDDEDLANTPEVAGPVDRFDEISSLIRSELPEDKRQNAEVIATKIILRMDTQSFHSGPLPTPAMLADYEKVVPGLARHIVERSDKEQKHRHQIVLGDQEIKRNAIRHDTIQSYIGQAAGFVIAMTAITAGIYFVANGKSTAGLATIIVAIGNRG